MYFNFFSSYAGSYPLSKFISYKMTLGWLRPHRRKQGCVWESFTKSFHLKAACQNLPYSGRNHHKQQADSLSLRDSETKGKESGQRTNK